VTLRNHGRLPALAAAVAILLAACSGGATTAPAATTAPSAAATSAPSAAATTAAESLPPGVAPYDGAVAGSGKGMKIGYVSLGDSIPFVKLVSDSLKSEATVAGADFVFCDSELDSAKALACVQNFKVQNVQGILNFQLNETAAEEICKAGPAVPVIAIDIHQKPCEIAFMGADNTRAGNVLGEAVGAATKAQFDCKVDAVVLMTAKAAGAVIKLRSDGTIEGYKNICGEPTNYTEIDVPSIAIDEARTKFTDYLTTVPNAKTIIVMSLNDDMALGALAAAQAANRAANVYLGAHGGDPSGWKEVRCDPHWFGDVAYFPERYGKIGIPAIIDAIGGKTVQTNLYVNHKALTKDNILTFYPDAPAC
jgi:ribose transport system substrate-binding protein